MKNLLALIIVGAPLAAAQIVVPPPLMEVRKEIAAKDTRELFDVLAANDDGKHCTRNQKVKDATKQRFVNDFDTYIQYIACFASTMDQEHALKTVSLANGIAKKRWEKDIIKDTVELLNESFSYLAGMGLGRPYLSAAMRTIATAREIARTNGFDASKSENDVVKAGYDTIAHFYGGIELSQARLLRDYLRTYVSNVRNADVSDLERRAAKAFRKTMLECIERENVSYHMRAEERYSADTGYTEGFIFSEEFFPSTDKEEFINGVIAKTNVFIEYAKDPAVSRRISEFLDFAEFLNGKLPSEARPKYESTIKEFRRRLK